MVQRALLSDFRNFVANGGDVEGLIARAVGKDAPAPTALAHPTPAPQPPTPIPEPATPIPPAPEPWRFILRTRAFLAHYLTETPAALDTLTFWCLLAWAPARTTVSPRLILHGLDPRADHARALRLLSWLAPNPRLIARATSYAVLELIAKERVTLLFDDAAHAILGRRDLRALIAAGAHRDGVFLGRSKGGKMQFRACAAPLAIATATAPPLSICPNAIVLPLAPAALGQGSERHPIGEPPAEAQHLRDGLAALARELLPAETAPQHPLPPFLSAAARETWAPLFALAEAIGGGAEDAILAASSQFGAPDHLEPPGSPLALLRDVRRITRCNDDDIPTRSLIEQLTHNPDSPWTACDHGAPITPRGLASRLSRFDVRPTVIYPPKAAPYRGYQSRPLLQAFARYLDDPVARALISPQGPE